MRTARKGKNRKNREQLSSELLKQATGIKKNSILGNLILAIFLPHALSHLRTSKVFLYHVNIYLKAKFAFGDYKNEIFSILSSARARVIQRHFGGKTR